jgi:recombination protein RecR
MPEHPEPIQRLIDAFKNLPGVGDRSAERFAYHVLAAPPQEAEALAQAARDVKTKIKKCKVCHNLADVETCRVCSDQSRRRDVICVVENHEAAAAIERTGSYRGLYHVLWGHISPIDGIGPGDITAASLINRVKKEKIREVILALNPTLEGDATILYLAGQLKPLNVKVTRPARGIASGADLARANATVIADALEGRSQL